MNFGVDLANRFREVSLNVTCIANTNFKNEWQGLDWQVATSKLNDFNTISVLAQHIHYYIVGAKNVFSDGKWEISDRY